MTTITTTALSVACDSGFNAGNPNFAKPSVRLDWKAAFESGVSITDASDAFKTRVAEGIARTEPALLDTIEKKFLSAGYQRGFYLGYAMFRGITDGTAAVAASLPITWEDIAEASQADDVQAAFDAIIEIGHAKKAENKAAKDAAKVDLVTQAGPFVAALATNAGKVLTDAERTALINTRSLINGLLG